MKLTTQDKFNLILGAIVVLGLLIGFIVKGAPLFEDDFEAYSLGRLNNKGDWRDTGYFYPNFYYEVSNSANCFSGQCLEYKGLGSPTAYRNTTGLSAGTLFFKFNPYTPDSIGEFAFALGDWRTSRAWGTNYCGSFRIQGDFDSYEVYVATNNTTYESVGYIFTPNVWVDLGFEWNFSATKDIRFYIGNAWTEWYQCGIYTNTDIYGFEIIDYAAGSATFKAYLDDFTQGEIAPPNYITITYPESGSSTSTAFTMNLEYENAELYNKIMILFEDWDASSTCPIYGDENYWDEYNAYFNYQSFPYYSPVLATSTGMTIIAVSGLAQGNYICSRCYFINENTGAISDEQCEGYTLTISAYIPPEGIPSYEISLPLWADYYAEHNDKWTTSTEFFNSVAGFFEPILRWGGNTILSFKNYFNPQIALERGTELGNAIPTLRGYVESIDDFFGSLPVSYMLLFYLISQMIVLVFKVVKSIFLR